MVQTKILELVSLKFQNILENSNKYYIATVEEEGERYNVVFKHGRLGRNPRIIEKPCTSLQQAMKIFENKVNEKRREGYQDYEIELIMESDGSFD